MSFSDKIKSGFKNFGHAIATGAKYFVQGVDDVVKGAAKLQAVEPEVEALVSAVAGPQAAAMADLGFHILGDAAQALQTLDLDSQAAQNAKFVNIPLDIAVAQDIKKVAAIIQGLLKAKGAAVPTAAA